MSATSGARVRESRAASRSGGSRCCQVALRWALRVHHEPRSDDTDRIGHQSGKLIPVLQPEVQKMTFTFRVRTLNFPRFISVVLLLVLFATPLLAQQPAPVARPGQTTARAEVPPPFEELLSADVYKVYGEVRNVGTLLSNGGAAEIIDPITKLADPGPQFKSLVSFLKK